LIDASKAKTIHPDILEIFADFEVQAISKDIEVEITGLNSKNSKLLNALEEFTKVVTPESKNKDKGLLSTILPN
jgi:hypothetical protein